ncbi:MAG: hypothetical protein M1343_08375 [Chloroflexi bacterium]|nr:hypothetical protein [Chloroflexota bacterium]
MIRVQYIYSEALKKTIGCRHVDNLGRVTTLPLTGKTNIKAIENLLQARALEVK